MLIAIIFMSIFFIFNNMRNNRNARERRRAPFGERMTALRSNRDKKEPTK